MDNMKVDSFTAVDSCKTAVENLNIAIIQLFFKLET